MELDEAQADVGQEDQEVGDCHASNSQFAPIAGPYPAHSQAPCKAARKSMYRVPRNDLHQCHTRADRPRTLISKCAAWQ